MSSGPSAPSGPGQPALVGRSAELAHLEAALSAAVAGQGRAIFLAGEPGIGKTRLARELLACARRRGCLVLEGQAYPLERDLAYGPVLAALGPFLRSLEAAHRARLVDKLLDLGRLFANLHLAAPEVLGDPALEKSRLFEAVARLVERLAHEAPVVLFLDDLHYADAASIELLHYVARGLAEQAVLLLGSYRPAEVDSARGLRPLLTSLRRAGLAEELALTRLGSPAVAALAHSLLGSEVSEELLALIEARAGGTPLFVESLIRAAWTAGQLHYGAGGWHLAANGPAPLPDSIRDVILGRLEHLDAPSRRLLDLLAVSGEAPAHAVLHAVSGLDEEQLLAALDRLRAAGLVKEIVTGADVTYSPTHPLIQEVAYGELAEIVRRRLHAAYAAVLERQRPDDLARLARHYQGAGAYGDQDRALAVLLAAGERARAVYANDEAAHSFSAALALVRGGRRVDQLPWLLERLGEAWARVGESAAAVAVWTEALAAYQQAGDAAAVARLCRLLALTEWDRGQCDAAYAHLEHARGLLTAGEPSPALVELLYVQVIILARLHQPEQLRAAVGALVAAAEHLQSPPALALARTAELGADLAFLDFDAAHEHGRLALQAAETAGDPVVTMRVLDILLVFALSFGDVPRLRDYARRSLELSRALGAPGLSIMARMALIFADILAGHWQEARRQSADALALTRRLAQPRGIARLLAVHALVLLHHGEHAPAAACIAEARQLYGDASGDRHVSRLIDVVDGLLALEQGQAERAHAIAAVFQDSPATPAPLGMAVLGEVQIQLGDTAGALVTADQIRSLAGDDGGYLTALAARVEGLARQAHGDAEAAMAALGEAVAIFERLAMPFEAARVRLAWAASAALAQPDAARTAAQASLAVFEQLGAPHYVERARQALHQLGVRVPTTTRRRGSPGPLSARELDVARLVVDGLSNAEIAERLAISPRTVSTHLENMYGRLGLASRTALARYVIESGLTPSAEPQNT